MTTTVAARLLNPASFAAAEFDPTTQRLFRATIDWFEAKGKARLTAEVRTDGWYADFIDFPERERAFATLLTPAREAGGDPHKRGDTARNAAFNEILGLESISCSTSEASLASYSMHDRPARHSGKPPCHDHRAHQPGVRPTGGSANAMAPHLAKRSVAILSTLLPAKELSVAASLSATADPAVQGTR